MRAQGRDLGGPDRITQVAFDIARRGGDVSDAARAMLRQVGLPRNADLMAAIRSLDVDATSSHDAARAGELLRGLAKHRVYR
jgi:hypothetical protein